MAEQKTLALNPGEWKALLLNNIAGAHQAVTNAENISQDGLAVLNGHLDRIKGIAAAWFASQPPVPAAENATPAVTQDAAQANGAPPVKKRGGWPKGKKRNAPTQQAVQ